MLAEAGINWDLSGPQLIAMVSYDANRRGRLIYEISHVYPQISNEDLLRNLERIEGIGEVLSPIRLYRSPLPMEVFPSIRVEGARQTELEAKAADHLVGLGFTRSDIDSFLIVWRQRHSVGETIPVRRVL